MLVGTTLRSAGLATTRIIAVPDFLSLVSLTVGGLGVAAMPTFLFDQGFAGAALARIDTVEPVPDLQYLAVFPAADTSPILASVVTLLKQTCDFSKAYQPRDEGEAEPALAEN